MGTRPRSSTDGADRARCLLCGGADVTVILRVQALPVFCNVLSPSAGEARAAAKGDIELGFCPGCGATRNLAFDPALVAYGGEYENSLHFSPHFQEYARSLARRLVSSYGLVGATVLELGSGKGDFLSLLCDAGAGRGIGYDPSYGGESDDASGRLTFVRQSCPDSLDGVVADLVCCRHVLEHLERPGEMLAAVRRALRGHESTVVYFEVPDAGYMLRNMAIWDVIYEHPWYFSAPSLRRLLHTAGFAPLTVASSFGGQFLFAEGHPSSSPPVTEDDGELVELTHLAARFGTHYRDTVEHWAASLRSLDAAGRRVAVWGIGSKGVTFLNIVPGAGELGCVIDVNPRKHGGHVPGTGQQVIGPEAARDHAPDVVLVMNPLYADEVRAITAGLGIAADIVAVEGR